MQHYRVTHQKASGKWPQECFNHNVYVNYVPAGSGVPYLQCYAKGTQLLNDVSDYG